MDLEFLLLFLHLSRRGSRLDNPHSCHSTNLPRNPLDNRHDSPPDSRLVSPLLSPLRVHRFRLHSHQDNRRGSRVDSPPGNPAVNLHHLHPTLRLNHPGSPLDNLREVQRSSQQVSQH